MDSSGFFNSPNGEDDQCAYHTPIETKVRAVLTPFQEFIKGQTAASIFLLLCTIIALTWASIPTLAPYYHSFTNIPIGLKVAHFNFEKPLHFWVNDIFLVLFFFFVGLEIKREFLVGELTQHKKAAFIIFSAIGGILLPALLYYAINFQKPTQFAWGIPTATDTAFALGILSCFRHKLPSGIFTFLAALAIIDDISAILVIAIFYTTHLNTNMLLLALVLSIILLAMNYIGFRKPWPYLLIGLFIWAALEAAGVHGTVAGILAAFLIPARPKKGPKQFIEKTRELLNYFEKRRQENPIILEDSKQHVTLEKVQTIAQDATTPLQRWESKLELPVALCVLPLFALVNAGIPINLKILSHIFTEPASLGILIGLVIGKPLGVLIFSRFALWCRFGALPENTQYSHIICAALLTGIGFTMSVFITDLSFSSTNLLVTAKAAVLLGSLMSGLAGIIALLYILKRNQR